MAQPQSPYATSTLLLTGAKLAILGALAVYGGSRSILILGLVALVALSFLVPLLRPLSPRSRLLLGLCLAVGPLIAGTVFLLADGEHYISTTTLLGIMLGLSLLTFLRFRVVQNSR